MTRAIAFIPARGGSDRVPGKNLQKVGDVSLAARAVLAGISSGMRAVMSSDVNGMFDAVAREVGYTTWVASDASKEARDRPARSRLAFHARPPDLAGPHSQIENAILHWMRHAELEPSDVIVLLQPTSPFRRAETIRECVRLVSEEGYDSALTVTLDFHRDGRVRSHEDGTMRILWNHPDPLWRPRSQDVRPQGFENGCVYAFTVEHFRKTACRMGGREACVPISRWEAFEIDTPEDLEVARMIAPMFDRVECVRKALAALPEHWVAPLRYDAPKENENERTEDPNRR